MALMVLIHEKIVALLEQRALKKRDLARALGVSPQTATDICKGRSAITLPHLRNLVVFFGLRADYWLDDSRLEPEPQDQLPAAPGGAETLARTGLLQVADPERLFQRMRSFVADHRPAFLARFPDLGLEDKRLLGFLEQGQGMVGRVGAVE
jgi:transcriptional regulator with XRE-family HTH domain